MTSVFLTFMFTCVSSISIMLAISCSFYYTIDITYMLKYFKLRLYRDADLELQFLKVALRLPRWKCRPQRRGFTSTRRRTWAGAFCRDKIEWIENISTAKFWDPVGIFGITLEQRKRKIFSVVLVLVVMLIVPFVYYIFVSAASNASLAWQAFLCENAFCHIFSKFC